MKVQLKESAYGTTAVVLISTELVAVDGPDPLASGGFPAGTGSPSTYDAAVVPNAGPDPTDPVGTAGPETGDPVGGGPPPVRAPVETSRLTPSGPPGEPRARAARRGGTDATRLLGGAGEEGGSPTPGTSSDMGTSRRRIPDENGDSSRGEEDDEWCRRRLRART